ncbi:MAG TPA: hypothetical protein VFH58_09285 [Acidimicrobiales bacterium]|nr:hypothetical protein [Acidimicrobiales bacterium]
MRMARWGAAAAAALTTCVPFVAEAATSPSTQTATSSTGSATTPTTAPGTATPAGTASSKVQTAVTGATAPKSAPAHQTSPQPTAQQSTQQSSVSQPAPPGSAEAYAAQVGDVAAISHTKASASSGGDSATADPLELGGNPPAAAFGGTESNGNGSKSGALLDTGKQPFGRLALTPWTTTNSTSTSNNSASGLADIVWLDLGDTSTSQSASLRVLQSQSSASWTPEASTGSASSDGAILDLGGPNGLAVDVLHSQTSSSGAGSSYLLSINGNQIGTSDQAGGKCSVDLPGVLSLDCLTASGGLGSNGVLSSAAGAASATVGPSSSGLTAALIQSKSTSAKAPAAVTPAATSPAASAPAAAPPAAAPPASAPAAAPASAAPAASSRLPFTGANVGFLVGAALLLGGAGAGIVLVSRRPRAAARR